MREIREAPNTPSIGSGPFTLTEWNRGRGWTLERNPYYWGAEPAVDRIEYTVYSNQEAMVQALRNGEIDIADGVSPQLIASVEGMENVAVQQVVSDWWLNLAFNFGGQGPNADPLPALQDHVVREAIAMAINKEDIVKKVYRDVATTGDTIIRPASAFWHLDIPAADELPFDIPGANALLDEAGYADTDDDGVREDPTTGEPLEMLIPRLERHDRGGGVGQVDRWLPRADRHQGQPDARVRREDGGLLGGGELRCLHLVLERGPRPELSVLRVHLRPVWRVERRVLEGSRVRRAVRRATHDDGSRQRQQVVFEAQQYVYDQIPGVVLAYPGWLQAYRTDRFTGWVPAPGPHGYLTPAYNYDSFVELRAVSAEAAAASGTVGVPGWIWVAGIAVLGLLALIVVRRSRREDVDEG